MKSLADGTQVSSWSWYYLLEFGDQTAWEYLREKYATTMLHSLKKAEYWDYFEHATQTELKNNR
jgi:hypothetical protein